MSTLHSAGIWLIALVGAALISGCDEPLKVVSLIQETRVLGARIEVSAEPKRAAPRPGEQASVRFFVAGPGEPPKVSYALSVCGVSPTNSGFPSCATPAFAAVSDSAATTSVPELAFEVPSDLDLDATPHGFVSGEIAGGEVAFEFELGSALHSNDNPELSDGSLSFDGQPWLPVDAGTDCGTQLVQVSPSSSHVISVALSDGDFDALTPDTLLDPSRETLLLSQFSDSGKLDHAFTSLSPSTSEGGSARWTAPSNADGSGTIAHFYFVVRDSRGGEDLATRTLCVVVP
jgi:hypothetical protein